MDLNNSYCHKINHCSHITQPIIQKTLKETETETAKTT